MKQQLKQILNHTWFFPIILLNYGLFYILFCEKYPASDGFGTDGYVYQTLITQFTNSQFYDSYFIQRVLPSFSIRLFLNLFSIPLSPKNIFNCFEIINLFSLVCSAYFIKKILSLFQINFKKQLLAFTLIYINFALLKWPFYFPVMLDTISFNLSILLLYFYLKNNSVGIIIITIILAFTWPMGYYQGLLLLAFPYKQIEFKIIHNKSKIIIYALSALVYLTAFIYIILIKKADTHLSFVSKIDRSLLPISAILVLVLFVSFSKLFLNLKLFDIKYFYKSLNFRRLLIAGLTYVSIISFIHFLDLPKSVFHQTFDILENPITHSLVRPMLTLVAHFTFFGIGICLLLFYWNKTTSLISSAGWGLVGAIALNLFLFGIIPESRALINLFPWIIIFMVLAINKINFSNTFYYVIFLMNLFASRLWFVIDLKMNSGVDSNGCIAFPDQVFFMNMGPWMSEKAYYYQLALMVVSCIVLFFVFFKVEHSENKWHMIARNKTI